MRHAGGVEVSCPLNASRLSGSIPSLSKDWGDSRGSA